MCACLEEERGCVAFVGSGKKLVLEGRLKR